MNKKRIITIILVLLVVLLGGASVYVATQLSTRKAVAPTAPESKPKASEPCVTGLGLYCSENQVAGATACTQSSGGEIWCCPIDQAIINGICVDEWVGSAECNLEGTASATVCTPSGVVTCTPDCPTTCGSEAATITTCTDSCGAATTKACAATAACAKAVLEGDKTAYKNVTSNTPGVYALTSLMETVSKSQIYVYTVELTNTSETTASGVVIKDSLADMPVTFMDTVTGCTFNVTSIELTCNTSVKPDETKKFSFRVKAADGVANGTVISNTAKVTYPDGSLDLTKDLAVSTVVGCNHTCTTDAECSSSLSCDTTTSKCRDNACLTEEDCVCVIAAAPTTRITSTPTEKITKAPTKIATAAATPTILPETGIFDLPGIVAFGGGLLLAVIGILLAL
jgi:uncharacterized repeat protein (TIGR01451 family)